MKLKFISVLALTLIAGVVIGADTPPISIAVFNFTTPYTARLRNDVGVVDSLLTVNLSSNPQFTLVDRAQLDKILKEQAFGLSGNISPETAAKIGKLVGAKVLVTGQIFSMDDDVTKYDQPNGQGEILIAASVIGTETGRIFAQREQGSRENLVKMADDLSAKISETVTNQNTNFVAAKSISTSERFAEIINSIQGKPHPAVSIQINEQILRMARPARRRRRNWARFSSRRDLKSLTKNRTNVRTS